MRPKPYVSAAGVASIDEVVNTIVAFDSAGFTLETEHMPIISIQVSSRFLTGQPVTNPLYAPRFPDFNTVLDLLDAARGEVYTSIHYNTKNKHSTAEEVAKIFDHGDNNAIYDDGLCEFLQINRIWPDVLQLKEIKEDFPKMKIILQASKGTPEELIDGINIYAAHKAIDYVIIDPSWGQKKDFDMETSLKIYRGLKSEAPDLGITFAGGLCGENIEQRLNELISEVEDKNFSICAEGGLRDDNNQLDNSKVQQYVSGAAEVLGV